MKYLASLLISATILNFGKTIEATEKNIDIPKATTLERVLNSRNLSHSVDGYEVACNRERAVVWGKPKKINSSNPQGSEITLIDLKRKNVVSTNSVSGGVFEIKYLAQGGQAYVGTSWGQLLNLDTGSILSLGPSADPESLNFEACDDFPGKSHLKYAK